MSTPRGLLAVIVLFVSCLCATATASQSKTHSPIWVDEDWRTDPVGPELQSSDQIAPAVKENEQNFRAGLKGLGFKKKRADKIVAHVEAGGCGPFQDIQPGSRINTAGASGHASDTRQSKDPFKAAPCGDVWVSARCVNPTLIDQGVPGEKGDKGPRGEPGFGYDCAGNLVPFGSAPAKCPGPKGDKGDKGDRGPGMSLKAKIITAIVSGVVAGGVTALACKKNWFGMCESAAPAPAPAPPPATCSTGDCVVVPGHTSRAHRRGFVVGFGFSFGH